MAQRKTPQEQLAELEQKQAQIAARIQKKKAEAKAAERKRDTRRKVIAGALALDHAAIDPIFGSDLKRLIDTHVKRPEDRALFDL